MARFGGLRSLVASKRRWCDAHAHIAPGTTVDFVSRPCVSCGLLDVLLPNGLCVTCQPDPRTGKPVTRRLALQRQIESVIRTGLPTDLLALLVSVDTVPDQLRGCTKRRPDLLFDCGTHAVVVEVDEEQHRCTASGSSGGYTHGCEQTRMAELTHLLWQATGCVDGYGVHWIRHNPSKYRPAAPGEAPATAQIRGGVLLRVLCRALRAPSAYVRTVGTGAVGGPDDRPVSAVTELFFDGWSPWQAGIATDLELGSVWRAADGVVNDSDPTPSVLHDEDTADEEDSFAHEEEEEEADDEPCHFRRST